MRRTNIRWKPTELTGVRHGKRTRKRERIVIEPGVSFERYEYEQAMKGWNP
jgi:hypothetical protein